MQCFAYHCDPYWLYRLLGAGCYWLSVIYLSYQYPVNCLSIGVGCPPCVGVGRAWRLLLQTLLVWLPVGFAACALKQKGRCAWGYIHAPFSVRYCPLIVKLAPFSVRWSPFFVNYAPLSVRSCPFFVRFAPFSENLVPSLSGSYPSLSYQLPSLLNDVPYLRMLSLLY